MGSDKNNSNSEYMYDIIDKIIQECGPRMPCSPQEEKAAKIIESELRHFCDEVKIEEFTCAPRAFLGWIRIVVILIACSMILYIVSQFLTSRIILILMISISVSLNILSFLIMWKEFFNYEEFIDKIFKKKRSQNVIGKINSRSQKKRIIIFSGHHDSALQFNLLYRLKIGYLIILFVGLIVMVLWGLLAILILIIELINLLTPLESFIQIVTMMAIILFFIGIIPLISLFNFVSSGDKANKVPGAVDNLSAIGVILGIGKFLKKNKHLIPENVEIRLISFGCEEAGLRGAYRYIEHHYKELKEFDAVNINMDALQESERISIIEYEPTTRTRHSEEVVESLLEAGNKMVQNVHRFGSGGKEKSIGQFSGGTDAAAFSKAGIKAATISSMKLEGFIQYYHQPNDTLDKIEQGTLENVMKLCIGYIKNFRE